MLTEDSPMCDTPQATSMAKGFKNVELFAHQKTAVYHMRHLEDNRRTTLKNEPSAYYMAKNFILNEPFGSGKTFDILALIMLKPVPKAYPTLYCNKDLHLISRCVGPSLIDCNCILVGNSVIFQWEEAIKTFTNLRVFTIYDRRTLDKFEIMFGKRLFNRKDTINGYDIVLVKNGKTISPKTTEPADELDSADGDGRNILSIANEVNRICKGYCWARVFYDDFDTNGGPKDAEELSTLSTWYISATNKKCDVKTAPSPSSLSSLLINSEYIMAPKSYFDHNVDLAVTNAQEFIKLSTGLPKVMAYQYVYRNPDDKIIGAIGAMGGAEIMEMLNGDAVGTAAAQLGINSVSVADIFQKMLDNNYDRFIASEKRVAELTHFANKLRHLPFMTNKEGDATEHSDTAIKTALKDCHAAAQSRSLVEACAQEIDAARKTNAECRVAIDRVMENIKMGECQICCLPLTDADVIINKCCGAIICAVCCTRGNQMSVKNTGNKQSIAGACANCKRPINAAIDMVFIDRSFDVSKLLEAKGDETDQIVTKQEKEEEPSTNEYDHNPKVNAIITILHNGKPSGQKPSKVVFKNLLPGADEVPAKRPIKALIFANYEETLDLIKGALTKHSITFVRLNGTAHEMAHTVDKFKNSATTCILINASHYCAGLNLQIATDVIFAHDMDDSIKNQVAGRGHRIGRTDSLRIHSIMYDNESKKYT